MRPPRVSPHAIASAASSRRVASAESVQKKAKSEDDTVYQVAYAVAYIVSETPQTGLTLLVGSDETARIYLNGKE